MIRTGPESQIIGSMRCTRSIAFAFALLNAASVACGQAETGTAVDTETPVASGPRIGSPSPTLTSNLLGTGNCTDTPSGTSTEPLGYDNVVLQIPPGWLRVSPGPSETVLLQLNAPNSYANNPTVIRVQSFIGPISEKNPHDAATDRAAQDPQADAASVTDCSAAGGAVAFYKYARGGTLGYQFLLMRADSQYAGLVRLYGVAVEGSGGLDPDAITDAKKLLGSWRWGA